MARIATVFYPQLFNAKEASRIYDYLKNNIKWEAGYSTKRSGFTRMAAPMGFDDDEQVATCIAKAMSVVKLPEKRQDLGVYLNYYRDGNDYTPAHSHKKQVQIIMSFGATRTLTIGKKAYKLNSGDAVVFGSSIHSVPKEPDVKDGRISIATFSLCLDKVGAGPLPTSRGDFLATLTPSIQPVVINAPAIYSVALSQQEMQLVALFTAMHMFSQEKYADASRGPAVPARAPERR